MQKHHESASLHLRRDSRNRPILRPALEDLVRQCPLSICNIDPAQTHTTEPPSCGGAPFNADGCLSAW